ncbi:hypothetical protein Focb16_v005910 [Fusarium oxysporum f. sp. cubense]|uniref:Uncharacterized protein n=1 Tax=Fusarium oxysporum f. sp. cubense TaxID=61366 RepID=A0A559LHF9_FUSOC|nr:hypothetical protein Focb16_v005910 [Fusarium oxysporum f. sp. cubense]
MDNGREISPDFSPQRNPHLESSRKITPPERNAPPSPPATAERTRPSTADGLPQSLVNFKRKAETCDVLPLTSIPLSEDDYNSAHKRIESTFLKFDFEPRPGHIVLRMPSPTHDAFVWSIASAIFDEISSIGRRDEAVLGFTSKILSPGSSRILLDLDDDEAEAVEVNKVQAQMRRQPDAQYQHKDAALPGVVIEVSYTQDRRRLPKIAKEYIHHSDGDIKVVVCIDINSGSESTISLWKARFTPEEGSDAVTMHIEQVVQSHPFRTANGNPMNRDSKLTLDLHDFAPDELSQDYPNIPISIPYSKICDFLNTAEQLHQSRESKNAKGVRSTRRVQKRKLPSSPVEELSPEDEEKFKAKEELADTKEKRQDGDFELRAAKRRA